MRESQIDFIIQVEGTTKEAGTFVSFSSLLTLSFYLLV